MRLLLDTHAWIWWTVGDRRLSVRALEAIVDESNDVAVSAATAWEVATKERLRRLDVAQPLTIHFIELIAADGFDTVPVNHVHGLHAGSYAIHHRDPFDRMLAAQCELDGFTLVTRDQMFEHFGIETLW